MPKNILEVINENINTTNENVLELIKKVATMEQEVIALRLMFKVPEQPNVIPGSEGIATE